MRKTRVAPSTLNTYHGTWDRSTEAQQWKEGLRSIVPDQLTAKEREVEELRTLLRRGGGIGTPNDQWTPYTGPSEAEVLQKAVAGYWQDVDTIESSDGSRR